MTVRAFLENNPNRPLYPPESIFAAQNPNGNERVFCLASFAFAPERDSLLQKYPDLLSWEVTKEHFTQEEIDKHRAP